METADLLITNARLRDGSQRDIAILNGRVHAIGERLPRTAARTIDAAGRLVTESFCNPHLHLDKVFSLSRLNDDAMRDYHSESMGRAMAMGADVVGGIPWIEYTDRDAQVHVDEMFAIAQEFDADVSMLVDDAGDPGLRTTEMMALKAIETGRQGRVLVGCPGRARSAAGPCGAGVCGLQWRRDFRWRCGFERRRRLGAWLSAWTLTAAI